MFPLQALYGRQPLLPIDAILNITPSQRLSYPVYVQTIISRIQSIHEFVYERMKSVEYPDVHPKHRYPPFVIGTLVYVKVPIIKKTESSKLATLWRGPYSITEINIPHVLYTIQTNEHKKYRVHIHRLKKATRRENIPSTAKQFFPQGTTPTL